MSIKQWVVNKKYAAYAFISMMMLSAQETFAQQDTSKGIAKVAGSLKSQIETLKGPAMVISGVVGLVLTIIGIIEFKNLGDPAMRQQASVGKAVMNLVVGVALLTLTWWIGTVSSTFDSGSSYTITLD